MTCARARRNAAPMWPLALATILALAGCRVAEPAHVGKETLAPPRLGHPADELWLAAADEPQSIDPALCNDSVGSDVIDNLFAGLVELDPATLQAVPELAESWTISPDGRTYTFALRANVWSDGTPLTAHDFVFSLERVLDPATGCRFASMLYLIEGAEARHKGAEGPAFGVVAQDAHTLRITLRAPTPYFLQFLSYNVFRPVPKHVLERLEAAHTPASMWTRPQHVVSSGAFVLTNWRFKRDYVLSKNPFYAQAAKVRLRRVWVKIVPSAGTAVNLYRSGDIDWTGASTPLPSAFVAHLSQTADFYQEQMLSTYFFWLNTRRPPLNDPRVRRALSLSVDRRALTQFVLRGGQKPSAALVPDGLAGYTNADGLQLDVPRAQALLKEAGYGPGKPLPPLSLIYNTAESNRHIAEALQGMWRQNLGIHVELANQEWRVFLQRVAGGDFDLARMGWVGDYPDPTSFLHDVLAQNSGNNLSGWCDPAFEALLNQAASTQDETERLQLLHDAEVLMLEAAPLLPLFTSTQSGLMNPNLRGYRANIMGHHSYKHLYFDLPGRGT